VFFFFFFFPNFKFFFFIYLAEKVNCFPIASFFVVYKLILSNVSKTAHSERKASRDLKRQLHLGLEIKSRKEKN